MDKIDGYEIQKTILFETGYGFALGCVPGTPEKSAVWTFTQTAFGRDYYWKACYTLPKRTQSQTILTIIGDIVRRVTMIGLAK